MAKATVKWKSAVPKLVEFEIDVLGDPDGSGGIAWSQQIPDPLYGSGETVTCPAGVGYRITFKLTDNSGLQAQFDAAGPIFVKESADDPSPNRKGSKQIKPDSCTSDTLVITNWNYGKKRTLRYQLNFVDPAGNSLPPYDPIVNNGGGGVQPLC